MNACRASRRPEPRASAVGLVLALLLAACNGRAFAPAAVQPLERSSAPRAALPDDLERSAAQIARLALAGDGSSPAVSAEMEKLRGADLALTEKGEPPTDLSDNALDLVSASASPEAYDRYVEEMLTYGSPDPELRKELEAHQAQKPLAIAEQRMSEERRRILATYFNLISAPVSRLALGGLVNPIESGRAAILSLLVLRSESDMSTRERQALRAYRDFLARNPDSPQTRQIRAKVESFQDRLDRERETEALEAAQRAIAANRPDAALLHLGRAERLRPGTTQTRLLQERAQRQLDSNQVLLARDLSPRFSAGDLPLDPPELPGLATRILLGEGTEPPPVSSDQAGALLADELAFVAATDELSRGKEGPALEALTAIARGRSNLAPHAAAIVQDPYQNPYAAHQTARRGVSRRQTAWLFLGNRATGPRDRDFPTVLKPLGWLLEVPAYAVVILTTPVRLLQYPTAGIQFRGPLLATGERYIARFPNGTHAEEIHRELESLYAERQGWAQALTHHRALPQTNPLTIAKYRESLAERLLEAARAPRRIDVKNSIYEELLKEYGETQAARTGAEELKKLLAEATPQSIRVTKEFLTENPELWKPGALPLRAELMDGEEENGELADRGVTLLGKNYVRIDLEDREPYTAKVPDAELARFVSLLQEAYERRIVRDARAAPDPDPQRDVFFENIRLGLTDTADMRPSAGSEYVFEGTKEKFGSLRSAASILPVELVLRGGIEDLGVAAIPRLKMPEETRDAYLYR
jgi:hypothetical protein